MGYPWQNGVRQIPHWARRLEEDDYDASMVQFERFGTHDQQMPDRTPHVANAYVAPWVDVRPSSQRLPLRQRLAARFPNVYRLNADGTLTRLSAKPALNQKP